MITMLMLETESHTLSCLNDLDGHGVTGAIALPRGIFGTNFRLTYFNLSPLILEVSQFTVVS